MENENKVLHWLDILAGSKWGLQGLLDGCWIASRRLCQCVKSINFQAFYYVCPGPAFEMNSSANDKERKQE
jgi:hypothetical protein